MFICSFPEHKSHKCYKHKTVESCKLRLRELRRCYRCLQSFVIHWYKKLCAKCIIFLSAMKI